MIEHGVHILPRGIDLVATVGGPKDFQQVPVAQYCGIIINRNYLGVISEAVIVWIFFLPAGISGPGAQNSFQTSELGIRSPESS